MRLTKFEHVCLALEIDGDSLLVDPGSYSQDFIMPRKVVAVVITHEHPDHLSDELLKRILEANPKAVIIAHESITSRYPDWPTQAAVATAATTALADDAGGAGGAAPAASPIQVGPFKLQFFGGQHQPIDESMPVPPNLGVMINDTVYYPGDSFTIPTGPNVPNQIPTLALPVSAPWLKFDMSAKFLKDIHPILAFPTHDAILSEVGKQLVDRMIGDVANSIGTQYKRLDNSSIDLV